MAANNGSVPSIGDNDNGGLPGPVVQVERSDGPIATLLLDSWTSKLRSGYVKVGADEYVLPEYYRKYAKRLETFETRLDDVFVSSHPKAGTTWTQEMVWCIANDLDFVGAEQLLPERFPFLEHSSMLDFLGSDGLPRSELEFPDYVTDSVRFLDEMKSPRFIKTHLPWDLLPGEIRDGAKKPKIVYVARNPKDTCISFYHHCLLLEGYKDTFENFATLFLAGMSFYSPYWKHVLSYWDQRHLNNVLFITFEKMKKDLGGVIRKTADFLGKKLSEEQVARLQEHLSFASMSKNPSVNHEVFVKGVKEGIFNNSNGTTFMRKGQVDEWKTEMSADLVAQFDKQTAEHFQGTGLYL